jgi:hypothetical protein
LTLFKHVWVLCSSSTRSRYDHMLDMHQNSVSGVSSTSSCTSRTRTLHLSCHAPVDEQCEVQFAVTTYAVFWQIVTTIYVHEVRICYLYVETTPRGKCLYDIVTERYPVSMYKFDHTFNDLLEKTSEHTKWLAIPSLTNERYSLINPEWIKTTRQDRGVKVMAMSPGFMHLYIDTHVNLSCISNSPVCCSTIYLRIYHSTLND